MIKETQNKPEQERKAEKAVLSGRQKLLIRGAPDYKNHRCDWNSIRGPDVVLVLSGLPKWQ